MVVVPHPRKAYSARWLILFLSINFDSSYYCHRAIHAVPADGILCSPLNNDTISSKSGTKNNNTTATITTIFALIPIPIYPSLPSIQMEGDRELARFTSIIKRCRWLIVTVWLCVSFCSLPFLRPLLDSTNGDYTSSATTAATRARDELFTRFPAFAASPVGSAEVRDVCVDVSM